MSVARATFREKNTAYLSRDFCIRLKVIFDIMLKFVSRFDAFSDKYVHFARRHAMTSRVTIAFGNLSKISRRVIGKVYRSEPKTTDMFEERAIVAVASFLYPCFTCLMNDRITIALTACSSNALHNDSNCR